MNMHRNPFDYPTLGPERDEAWADPGRESGQRPPNYSEPSHNGTIIAILAVGVLLLIGIVLAT